MLKNHRETSFDQPQGDSGLDTTSFELGDRVYPETYLLAVSLLQFDDLFTDPFGHDELYALLEIRRKVVAKLTSLENDFFRKGAAKSAPIVLLFLLTKNVGKTPWASSQAGVLDYRYKNRQEIKVGELLEAWDSFRSYQESPNEDTASTFLYEIADVFFNLAQLDMATALSLEAIVAELEFELDATLLATKLVTLLYDLAIWKFTYRYVRQNGEKNHHQEKIYLNSIHQEVFGDSRVSMLALVQKNEALLQALLSVVQRLAARKLDSLLSDAEKVALSE